MKPKHLIGKRIKVVQATNHSNIGIEGSVLDDTASTLLIKTKDCDKRILKKGSVFEVESNIIAGNNIMGTPSERL